MKIRNTGLVHGYLDEKVLDFSDISIGIIARALGCGLNVGYYSHCVNSNIEDFFNKYFQFEFKCISSFDDFDGFDALIFDSIGDDIGILDIINKKSVNCEVVFVFTNKIIYEKYLKYFDLASVFEYSKNNSGMINLINVTGNAKGKSTYCFGNIIRNFINGKNVKLIYFDKGGDFYSERIFFDKIGLKYFATGNQRFDGNKFRFENIKEDYFEGEKGLNEIKNSKGYDLIVADELNTTLSFDLIDMNKTIDVISNFTNQVLISGRYSPKKIIDLCSLNIEIKEIKHYSKKGYGVKKGIDF